METQNNATEALALALADYLKRQATVRRVAIWGVLAAALAVALGAGGIAIYNRGFADGMHDGLHACYKIREA